MVAPETGATIYKEAGRRCDETPSEIRFECPRTFVIHRLSLPFRAWPAINTRNILGFLM